MGGDSSRILTASDLLSGRPDHYREVEVTAAGGAVLVRGLTARERQRVVRKIDELEQSDAGDHAYLELNALLAALGVVDEDGKQLFGADQVESLMGLDGRALDAIASAVLEESGLTQASMEALQGKSGPTASSASSSASPSASDAPSESS